MIETIKSEIDEEVSIVENAILKERVLADLYIENQGKKYSMHLYAKQSLGNELEFLVGDESKEVRPLQERLLRYKGYNCMYMDVVKWLNMNENERKEVIRNWFGKQ